MIDRKLLVDNVLFLFVPLADDNLDCSEGIAANINS